MGDGLGVFARLGHDVGHFARDGLGHTLDRGLFLVPGPYLPMSAIGSQEDSESRVSSDMCVEWLRKRETNRTSGDEFEELFLEVADLGRHARFVLAMLLDAFLPVSGRSRHRRQVESQQVSLSLLSRRKNGATDCNSHLQLGLFKHLAHLLLIRLGELLPVRDYRLEFQAAVVAPSLVKVGQQLSELLTTGGAPRKGKPRGGQ